jgi:hypothetical protein
VAVRRGSSEDDLPLRINDLVNATANGVCIRRSGEDEPPE